MNIKRFFKQLFRRLKGCKHRYMPYQRSLEISGKRDGVLVMVYTWKCTKCGKLKRGKSIKEKEGTL